MSHLASSFASRSRTAYAPASGEATIVEDLRSFARDLGIHGWSAMTKDELVESLRQRWVLDQIRRSSLLVAQN